jgi:hypothetical protein
MHSEALIAYKIIAIRSTTWDLLHKQASRSHSVWSRLNWSACIDANLLTTIKRLTYSIMPSEFQVNRNIYLLF